MTIYKGWVTQEMLHVDEAWHTRILCGNAEFAEKTSGIRKLKRDGSLFN